METTRHILTKRTKDGEITVTFRHEADDSVTVITYSNWSDYETRIPMTKDEARASWADLVAQGFHRNRAKEAEVAKIAAERAAREAEESRRG